MGTNSIRSNLNKDDIISEIILMNGADINKDKFHVVVEGKDDTDFLKRFLDSNVILYESYSGKTGVEEIIRDMGKRIPRIIGIRDKDYCSSPSDANIFFYDNCCIEMMLLNSDQSYDTIYNAFYSGTVEKSNLKEHILQELKKISVLRKYNEQNRKNIKFDGLRIGSLVDANDKITRQNLVINLREINPQNGLDFEEIIDESIGENKDILLDITNGHDFLNCFKAICDKTKKNAVKAETIFSVLQAAFSNDDMKNTLLYNSICNHINGNCRFWCC